MYYYPCPCSSHAHYYRSGHIPQYGNWQVAPYYPNHTMQQPVYPERSFPPVDTEGLEYSAKQFRDLIKQADLLIDKIIDSPKFSHDLMSAAQVSDKKRVEELIKSTGISIKFTTDYRPTGLQITLDNKETEGGCCQLFITLRW